MKKAFVALLALTLLTHISLTLAVPQDGPPAAQKDTTNASLAVPQETPQAAQENATAPRITRASLNRAVQETRMPSRWAPHAQPQGRNTARRSKSTISNEELLLLTGVAGFCLAIGAVAGGGKGVAIGAIVAAPAVLVAHLFWKTQH